MLKLVLCAPLTKKKDPNYCPGLFINHTYQKLLKNNLFVDTTSIGSNL